ncbi:MAG TPA: hypothetical protein VK158_00715 [Acidobacteriota bacterium]|nr:hypothetical protein [Acidobacteriota bacterium]
MVENFLGQWYQAVILLHVLCAAVALGAVVVTDYLHLRGLRAHSFEKKLVEVYPILSQLINLALGGIYATGVLLVANNPLLIQDNIFLLKLALVLIVTANGIVLQKYIGPHVNKLIAKNKKFPDSLIKLMSLCGAISLVSWLSIFILSMTKTLGYTPLAFSMCYLIAVSVIFLLAEIVEYHSHSY